MLLRGVVVVVCEDAWADDLEMLASTADGIAATCHILAVEAESFAAKSLPRRHHVLAQNDKRWTTIAVTAQLTPRS